MLRGVVEWSVRGNASHTSYQGLNAAREEVVTLEHTQDSGVRPIDTFVLQDRGETASLSMAGERDGDILDNTFISGGEVRFAQLRRTLQLLQQDLQLSVQVPDVEVRLNPKTIRLREDPAPLIEQSCDVVLIDPSGVQDECEQRRHALVVEREATAFEGRPAARLAKNEREVSALGFGCTC